MKATEVADGIYRLSANGGPEILCESMWPLPHGIGCAAAPPSWPER